MSEPCLIEVDAKAHNIISVTVYQGRAEITRRFQLKLDAGQSNVEIRNLPTCMDESSLRVDGIGNAVIFDVIHEQAPTTPTVDPELTQRLRELKDERAKPSASSTRCKLKILGDFLDVLAAKSLAFSESADHLFVQDAELRREIDHERNKESRRQEGTKFATKVTLAVLAQESGSVELQLTYVVSLSDWKPIYDLRGTVAESTGKDAMTVSLSYRASISQTTIADHCGFEELTYEFYVQAFTIYEESISESRAQLQAITPIIGTLQAAHVFSPDNYDTLITKAALHGAKLLKKSHQATAVSLASCLWWQGGIVKEGPDDEREPLRDGTRVLECLQNTLRIANSCYEETISVPVQLYVQALDQYLYYFDHGVEAVIPKYVNSLVELIASNIDSIGTSDFHDVSRSSGPHRGRHTPDMINRHFRNTLLHMQLKKEQGAGRWSEVDIAGAVLKMGLAQ